MVHLILSTAPSQLPVQSEDLGERNAWHGSGGSGTGGREPANHTAAHKDSLLPLGQACRWSAHLTGQCLQLWARLTPAGLTSETRSPALQEDQQEWAPCTSHQNHRFSHCTPLCSQMRGSPCSSTCKIWHR